MEANEKHALIAKFEGADPRVEYIASDDGGKSMALWTGGTGITLANVQDFCRRHPAYKCLRREYWPDYSSDLNLCARAEAKIAEIGPEKQWAYAQHLYAEYLKDERDCIHPLSIITAPASARVDAMVALIQSMEPRP